MTVSGQSTASPNRMMRFEAQLTFPSQSPAMMESYLLFLDTNIFMHYQSFTGIDWCEITGSDNVTLAVASVVVQELDRHKDQHRSSKMRDRCRKVLKNIRLYTIEGRNDVNAIPYPEPNVDYGSLGLDKDINDDRLIASCIHAVQSEDYDNVILVSADTGPIIKASQLDIDFIDIPEEFQLPSVIDESDSEIKRLKLQVERLKNLHPKLSLVFPDGNTRIRFNLPEPISLSEDDILSKIENIKRTYAIKSFIKNKSKTDAISALLQPSILSAQPSQSEFDRYNSELPRFYKSYESYIRSYEFNKNIELRTIKLNIIISNTGNVPAEDIDIFLHFPDGFDVYDKFNKPIMPDEPSPPEPPKNTFEMMSSLSSIMNIPYHGSGPISPRNVSGLDIRKTNSHDVRFKINRLKHNMEIGSDPIYIVFDDFASASSFTIDYSIIAANTPNELEGKLHVIIDN